MRDHDRLPDLPYLGGLPRPSRRDVDVSGWRDGNAYLHELCRRDAPLVLVDDAVRALGADIDLPNAAGETPLALAILHGTPVLVRRLLELGASVDLGDFNAVLLAVDARKPEMVYVLLRHGAGPALNRGGRLSNGRVTRDTPLLAAADNRHTEIYGPLISAGAFVNARREDGQTALHLAAAGSDDRAVPLLLSRGADANALADDGWMPLHIAAARGRAGNIAELVGAGADIEAANRLGQTPLIVATEYGHVDCVKALLQAGVAVDARADGMEKRTALMIAARKGHTELVKVLLAAGADPLLEDGAQVTAAGQVARTVHTDLYLLLRDEEQTRLRDSFEQAHRRMTQNQPPRQARPPRP